MSIQLRPTFECNKENFDYMTQKWTPPLKNGQVS